ncbi:MAG: CotH kinase family protein [Cyclobacteriaceae bacterium]|nr:CotH kinase family protein [Cyclobacteriaceae bacterium]
MIAKTIDVLLKFFTMALLWFALSCEEAEVTTDDGATSDWTETTHGNKVEPNYEEVFPQHRVNSIEITLTSADWLAIQQNMKSLYGFAFGAGGTQPPGGDTNLDPDYIPVSVKYNDKQWYKVGFRLKGNSTLKNSWRGGIYKLPFRLNMDRYEDEYPEYKNQRFYGFKELSMSPGANDNSLIREKAGSDIFRMAGIPCSQTAFYKVYINFGEGVKYCGVYTMVEVVDDTMLENQLGNKSGNIYKPESNFKSFVQSQFEKKNNEDEADYADVQATIAILNNSLRNANPAQWRAELEQVFNVSHFLQWLSVNTTMLNWDTYGRMAHNYYLYNQTDGLMWIPWDNNECMMNRGGQATPISLSTVGDNWPLIRNLMDDPVYGLQYKEFVQVFSNTVFKPDVMNTLFTQYHELISPYVIGPMEIESGKYTHLSNSAAFTNELTTLKQHVVNQNKAAVDYLK